MKTHEIYQIMNELKTCYEAKTLRFNHQVLELESSLRSIMNYVAFQTQEYKGMAFQSCAKISIYEWVLSKTMNAYGDKIEMSVHITWGNNIDNYRIDSDNTRSTMLEYELESVVEHPDEEQMAIDLDKQVKTDIESLNRNRAIIKYNIECIRKWLPKVRELKKKGEEALSDDYRSGGYTYDIARSKWNIQYCKEEIAKLIK